MVEWEDFEGVKRESFEGEGGGGRVSSSRDMVSNGGEVEGTGRLFGVNDGSYYIVRKLREVMACYTMK